MTPSTAHRLPQHTGHSSPRAALCGGQALHYQPGDMAYGELALTRPQGHTPGEAPHVLDWQTQHPVRLLPHVHRLTAPNPGAMTGPGTNSYIVGDPRTGYIAIDPGPNDGPHIERLWRAAVDADGQPGDIRHIVCTHSHPDHYPGAQPLQAMCEQIGRPKPLILGLASGPHARSNCAFTPERELLNNELLVLAASALEGDLAPKRNHTLKIIHTPGHASNHLCLVLLGNDHHGSLLFSGDHVLNGSTTVIDPPDGNMADYLASLDLLSALCAATDDIPHGIDFILPAHGWVLGHYGGGAGAAIAKLKAHRLQREAKIIGVMRALPHGNHDEWVALAYDDAPQRLWPVAKRSLLAHVERIQALGLVD